MYIFKKGFEQLTQIPNSKVAGLLSSESWIVTHCGVATSGVWNYIKKTQKNPLERTKIWNLLDIQLLAKYATYWRNTGSWESQCFWRCCFTLDIASGLVRGI